MHKPPVTILGDIRSCMNTYVYFTLKLYLMTSNVAKYGKVDDG